MKVVQYEQIESTPVKMENAVGCRIRCLIGEPDGARPHYERYLELEPGEKDLERAVRVRLRQY